MYVVYEVVTTYYRQLKIMSLLLFEHDQCLLMSGQSCLHGQCLSCCQPVADVSYLLTKSAYCSI